MATRKQNFFATMRANPKLLKGKTPEEAYAAMRREAGRQRKSPNAADASQRSSVERAIERRLRKSPTALEKRSDKKGSPYERWSKGGFKASPAKGGSWWDEFQRSGGFTGRKNSKGQTLGDQLREDLGHGKKDKDKRKRAAQRRWANSGRSKA